MNDSTIIDVRSLSHQFSTRHRGEEAYKKLAPTLSGNQQVVVDFDGVELVSPSFIDGLLLRLIEHQQMVYFKANKPRIVERLRRIGRLRKVTLMIWNPGDYVEALKPGPF
jgi:hypothetical protein